MEIDYIEEMSGKIWESREPFSETGFNDDDAPKYYPTCIIKEIEGGRFEISYFEESKWLSDNFGMGKKKRFEDWVNPNAKIILYPNAIKKIKLK